MKKVKRSCAVPGCAENIPGNRLMCEAHWNKVPKPTQAKFRRIAKDGNEVEWIAVVKEVINIAI
jgi:hypothetical protein